MMPVELYQILKTPLDQINKTHTAIGNIQMDSYTVSVTTAPTILVRMTDAEVGGVSIFASEIIIGIIKKTLVQWNYQIHNNCKC